MIQYLIVQYLWVLSVFSALTLLVGRQEGIRPVKNLWGACVVICLEQGADSHVAQLMPLPLVQDNKMWL